MKIPSWRKYGYEATMWMDRTGFPALGWILFWSLMIFAVAAIWLGV